MVNRLTAGDSTIMAIAALTNYRIVINRRFVHRFPRYGSGLVTSVTTVVTGNMSAALAGCNNPVMAGNTTTVYIIMVNCARYYRFPLRWKFFVAVVADVAATYMG